MTHVLQFTDDMTTRVAALLRAGDPDRQLYKSLYEGKPSYGPNNSTTGKERILEALIADGVPVNGRLAHAYERGFYFKADMLALITRDQSYRMAVAEARAMLGTVSYGDPR